MQLPHLMLNYPHQLINKLLNNRILVLSGTFFGRKTLYLQ